MSTLTTIKDKIRELDPAGFQEFCDRILSKLHPDWHIHELGLMAGRTKTTTGNPDTYFMTPEGRYAFVAYTTKESGSLYEKLHDDIEKCLDPDKTGLSVSEIDCMIACHTSSNLKAGDDYQLHALCNEASIPLTIYGIDELATLVLDHFPSIASDYLHVSVDTGQILEPDAFIRAYNSAVLIPPVNTHFLFRESELSEIHAYLDEDPIVLIHGPAGVGKTRLALEAARRYASEKEYSLFCIRSNHQNLYPDFVRVLEIPGRYLFLIDDANEMNNLTAVILYAAKKNAESSDFSIKLVMTIRDYVKQSVTDEIEKCGVPYQAMTIGPFSDEEIQSFLKSELDIQNYHYLNQIVSVAEGNARIAYMAGRLAVEKQSLNAVHNAADLLDQYYRQFTDQMLGSSKELCFSAGVLAVVKAVDPEDLTKLSEVFDLGIVDSRQFLENLEKLVDLEYARLENGVITYADQCFSNYMLYYVFFKKKIVPFADILDIGFRKFRDEVNDAAATVFNNFRDEKVIDDLNRQIKVVWEKYQDSDDSDLYDDFLQVYHTVDPEVSLQYAKNQIDTIARQAIPLDISFDQRIRSQTDGILTLLTGYQNSQAYFGMALELALEYAEKSEEAFVCFAKWFDRQFGINKDSPSQKYAVQRKAVSFLDQHKFDTVIVSKFCIFLAANWLAEEYQAIEAGRHSTLKVFDLKIKYTRESAAFRLQMLTMVSSIVKKYSENNDSCTDADHQSFVKERQCILSASENFLNRYAQIVSSGLDQALVKSEAQMISNIVNELPDSLIKAILADKLMDACEKRSTYYHDTDADQQPLPSLYHFDENRVFRLPVWNIYKICRDDRLTSGARDFDENNQRYEERIRQYAHQLSEETIPDLINGMNECIETISSFETVKNPGWSFNRGLEIIADELAGSSSLSKCFLTSIQRNGKSINISPHRMFEHLVNEDRHGFYQQIAHAQYASESLRYQWLWLYFNCLSEDQIDTQELQNLYDFLKDTSKHDFEAVYYCDIKIFLKFLKVDQDIFLHASRVILQKGKTSPNAANTFFRTMFWNKEDELTPERLLDLYQNDLNLLKSIYSFELKYSDLTDLTGAYLSCFYDADPSWLHVYEDCLFRNNRIFGTDREEQDRLKVLWLKEDYLNIFDSMFNRLAKNTDPMQCVFIRYRLQSLLGMYIPDVKDRQQKWFLHLVDVNAMDADRIQLVFFLTEELDDAFRIVMFDRFLSKNSDFQVFEKLSLLPHMEETSDSFVPVYEKQKEFLERLLDLKVMREFKYLEHRKWIKDVISSLDGEIQAEKKEDARKRVFS